MTLKAEGLRAVFGGIVAIDSVDLELRPGEILGVVGPNGSGKSTLFNCLTGFVTPAAGTVRIDDVDITRTAPHKRIARGLSRTFQTPRNDPDETVLATVMRGLYPQLRSSMFHNGLTFPGTRKDEKEATARALHTIHDLGLTALERTPMAQLSLGQARLVDVARAIVTGPRFVLLDEPAAGLDSDERNVLSREIKRVAASGVGVLLVEHNFALVKSLVDRLVVLKDGRVLAEGDPSEVAGDDRVIEAYLGVAKVSDRPTRSVPEGILELELTTHAFNVRYGRSKACTDIDLSIRTGRITAILGPNGAGKSSLLAGIAKSPVGNANWSGSVDIRRRSLAEIATPKAVDAGIALVPEGRGNIFPNLTVEENIQLGLRQVPSVERSNVYVETLDLFPALGRLRNSKAGLLSGGEQQMLAIALALLGRARFLLLDEPTQGLAPAILDLLVDVFDSLRTQGLGILLAEQNQAFASRLADSFVIISHGEIVVSGSGLELQKRDEIANAFL